MEKSIFTVLGGSSSTMLFMSCSQCFCYTLLILSTLCFLTLGHLFVKKDLIKIEVKAMCHGSIKKRMVNSDLGEQGKWHKAHEI